MVNFSVLSLMLDRRNYFHQQSKFYVYHSVSEWCRCMEFVVRQNARHIEHMFSWRAKY